MELNLGHPFEHLVFVDTREDVFGSVLSRQSKKVARG